MLEVKFNEALGIVESVFSDYVTEDELIMETKQCIALGKEKDSSLFLCDAKDAIVHVTILNTLILEKIHREDELKRSAKIAVIEPSSPESKEFAEFYETAFINRGWIVELFKDRNSAITWLQGKSE